jgi:hypothetical protein
MTLSSPYFRPQETARANGNCGKNSEMTDKRMKVKYLKIRFQRLDPPLEHQPEVGIRYLSLIVRVSC